VSAATVELRRTLAARRAQARSRRLSAQAIEGLVIFVAFFAAYALVGQRVVAGQHVVVFDALARLAHAFFVWHDAPPKLAAVGFEWPPLMTLVMLPFTADRALGSSLTALPLTSAVFAAGLLVTLAATLRLLHVPVAARALLIALFGLNPLFVFYAVNGMGEIPYLFFLCLGVFFLLRWHVSGEGSLLALAGISLALGGLTRYEIFVWGALFAPAIWILLLRRGAGPDEIEASLVLYCAPLALAAALWCFFNWLILGNGLFWLEHQASNVAVGRGNLAQVHAHGIPLAHIVSSVVELNAHLFALVPLAVVALIIFAVIRRDLMSAVLASAVSLNAIMTIAFIHLARDESLLQLRYNMRAMPLALVAMAWIAYRMPKAAWRWLTLLLTAAAMTAGIPLVWHTMKTYRYQFMESAFVHAIETGRDQEGASSVGGFRVGVAAERDMAHFILGLPMRRKAILTDDAQSFGVMLLSGHPELFFDRIGRGDAVWHRILEHPWGRVRYLLITRFGEPELARQRYPEALSGRQPGLTLVYENARYALFAVAAKPPATTVHGGSSGWGGSTGSSGSGDSGGQRWLGGQR
jgi:uncharacterized membrane protein YgcG